MLYYIQPVVFLVLIMMPFINNRIFDRSNKYNECVIICVDIESINVYDNIYFTDKQVKVHTYLENNDIYYSMLKHEEAQEFKTLFKEEEVDDDGLDVFIFKLRDFIDYVHKTHKKKTYVLLNTFESAYENYLTEYGLKKIINIRNMYGYYHDHMSHVPDTSSLMMINKIVSESLNETSENENETNIITPSYENTMVTLLEKW